MGPEGSLNHAYRKELFMKNLLRVLAVAALSLNVAACATTVPLEASTRTPAATGKVKVSKDSQGNSKLAIDVRYLPKPNDLDPSLTTFVVWSVADQGARVRNLGRLNIDNDRRGSVTVTSPLSSFRMIVTAETVGTVEKPSDYVVLSGYVGQS
jgi:hypothetical protein